MFELWLDTHQSVNSKCSLTSKSIPSGIWGRWFTSKTVLNFYPVWFRYSSITRVRGSAGFRKWSKASAGDQIWIPFTTTTTTTKQDGQFHRPRWSIWRGEWMIGSITLYWQSFLQNSFGTIAESPVSYITTTRLLLDSSSPLLAIKSASVLREYSRQPHDIRKELRILRSVSHTNVCYLRIALSRHSFWGPFRSFPFWATLSSITRPRSTIGCPWSRISFQSSSTLDSSLRTRTYFPRTCRPPQNTSRLSHARWPISSSQQSHIFTQPIRLLLIAISSPPMCLSPRQDVSNSSISVSRGLVTWRREICGLRARKMCARTYAQGALPDFLRYL